MFLITYDHTAKLCKKLQNSDSKLDSFIQINRNKLHGTQ